MVGEAVVDTLAHLSPQGCVSDTLAKRKKLWRRFKASALLPSMCSEGTRRVDSGFDSQDIAGVVHFDTIAAEPPPK